MRGLSTHPHLSPREAVVTSVVIVLIVVLAGCVPAAKGADAGKIIDAGVIIDSNLIIDAGVIVDSKVIIDAGVIVDAGSERREPPFSVGARTHCIAKGTARAHARPGGRGNIGFIAGCPSWVDRRLLPSTANGGIGALENAVTSSQQRDGLDVCCYFAAPLPP